MTDYDVVAMYEETERWRETALKLAEENGSLISQLSELKQQAEFYRYIKENHLRSHSPHMDGTWGWSFRGLLNGLHRTPEEAITHAIEETAKLDSLNNMV